MLSRSVTRVLPLFLSGLLMSPGSPARGAEAIEGEAQAAPTAVADQLETAAATPEKGAKPTQTAALELTADPAQRLDAELGRLTEPMARIDAGLRFLATSPGDPRAADVRKLVAETARALDAGQQGFIQALLELLDLSLPIEKREVAAKRLAELQDPRAIIPLIYAIQDPEPRIDIAVLEALGQYQGLAVERALTRVLEGSGAEAVRIAAAFSLGAQRTETAKATLLSAYRTEDNPRAVRKSAGEALDRFYPGYLASLGETGQVLDRRGRWLLVPASAAFGAYGLGTIGRFGKSAASVPIGIASGAVLGGASAFLLTQRQEMTYGQAASIVSGGAWGLWTGVASGMMGTLHRCDTYQDAVNNQSPDNYDESIYTQLYDCKSRSTDLVMGLGLLGEAAGLAATSLTLKHNPYTGYDVLTMDLGGLAGTGLVLGAEMLADPDAASSVGRIGGVLAGGLGGLIGTGAITRKLHFTDGDVALVAQGTLQGGWIGGWAPSLFLSSESEGASRSSGGVLLGASLGMIGGAALGQFTDFQVKDNLFMTSTSIFSYMLGAGLPMAANSSSRQTVTGSMLGVGLLGLGSSIALRNHVDFDAGDVTLTALGAGWGLWQGLGFSTWASWRNSERGLTGSQIGGAALLGTAIGGLSTMALSQVVEVSPWEVLMVTSGGMWGAWFSSWGGVLAGSTSDKVLLGTLIASDAGLAVGSLLLSPLIDVHPTRIGWANLGGLTGTALFSLGAALASSDRNTVITANLAGGALGLVAGGIVGSLVKVNELPRSPEKVGMALDQIGRWNPRLSMAPNIVALPGGAVETDGWLLNLSLRQPVN